MQVFVGFISRMINVCPMKSKEAIHIVAAHQDFMRHGGVPEALHMDAAPEQKVKKIMEINRNESERLMVRALTSKPKSCGSHWC